MEEKEPEQNIAKEFGEVAENLGLPGWSGEKGYRGSDGNLYTGFAALWAFVKDSGELINGETSPEWAAL